MTDQQKLTKLNNLKTDLSDDSSSITSINNNLQSVSDSFAGLIKHSATGGTCNKVEALKEASQSNDSNIRQAKSYCQYEINLVNKAMASQP